MDKSFKVRPVFAWLADTVDTYFTCETGLPINTSVPLAAVALASNRIPNSGNLLDRRLKRK